MRHREKHHTTDKELYTEQGKEEDPNEQLDQVKWSDKQ